MWLSPIIYNLHLFILIIYSISKNYIAEKLELFLKKMIVFQFVVKKMLLYPIDDYYTELK